MVDRLQMTQRDWLKLSAAGVLGASASGWFEGLASSTALAAPGGKPRKSCILLWMNGGPSRAHTFDLKDGGDFKPIPTSVPGIQISEHLPALAKQMHLCALLRGMSTNENVHERARYLMHTGYKQLGSVTYPALGCIASAELGAADAELPNFVTIDGGVDGNNAGGPFRSVPGHLGPRHAPLAVTDTSKGVANLKPFVGLEELEVRSALLDKSEERFAQEAAALAHRTTYQRALRLLHSDRAKAFELDREPQAVRDAYGSSQFGKACLLARRPVEAGVPFIEVTLGGWDDYGGAAAPFKKRSAYLDPAVAQLLADLKQRGLLTARSSSGWGNAGPFAAASPRRGACRAAGSASRARRRTPGSNRGFASAHGNPANLA